MSAEAFENNNLDWQIQQGWQRISEWLELKFFSLPVLEHLPNWSVSPNVLVLLCWLVLGAIALWLGWQLFKLLRPYLWKIQTLQSQFSGSGKTSQEQTFTSADWLQQAQKWQQQRNYRDACRALYMAMLQQLDETKRIPHQASRTDGEYLQQVQYLLPQVQPYQILIQTHEQICFSSASISAEMFNRCQQAYQQIASDR
jgi:hypothetical protein